MPWARGIVCNLDRFTYTPEEVAINYRNRYEAGDCDLQQSHGYTLSHEHKHDVPAIERHWYVLVSFPWRARDNRCTSSCIRSYQHEALSKQHMTAS